VDGNRGTPVNSGMMEPADVLAIQIANIPVGHPPARQVGHIGASQFGQAQLGGCLSPNEADFDNILAKSAVGPGVTLTEWIYLTGTTPPGAQWAVALDPGSVYFNIKCPAADQPWAVGVQLVKPR